MALKILLSATLVLLLGPLAAAQAFDSPECNVDRTTARPGLDRSYAMYCSHTDRVELVTPPAAGRLSGLALSDSGDVTWRFEPLAGAVADDSFVLDLTGPAGTVRHTVAIRTIPRDVNTPPVCDPVRHAERTDGAGPAELRFHVYCWDQEYDEIVIEGGGPGEHLSTPIAAESAGVGGGGVPWMSYRTKVSAGEEQASYWGTDVLGARSEDAPISLTVGPGVDRLPTCRPQPSAYGDGHFSILARPGATRRFAVICEDADGDTFLPRLGSLPGHGVITFIPGPDSYGFWGVERWIDTTYVPVGGPVAEDPFSVVATGLRGEAETKMAMVTRPLPDNGGGGCGWSGGRTLPGVPTVLQLHCDDDEGDELSATVTEGPLHGIAGTPVVTQGLHGWEDIAIPYAPQPGFSGVDLVEVTIADGNGRAMDVIVDVYVDPAIVEPPLPLPDVPLPEPDPLPVPGRPGPSPEPSPDPSATPEPTPPQAPQVSGPPRSAPAPDPIPVRQESFARPGAPPSPLSFLDAPVAGQAPARSPEDQARALLGTADVKLVRRIGEARIYAAARRRAGRPKVALTCALRCTVRIDPTGRSARSSRRVTAGPGRGARITLRTTRSDRRKGRVIVGLTVSDAAGSRRTARLRVGL